MKLLKTTVLTLLLTLNALAFAVPFGQDYLGGPKFQSAIIQNHDYSQGAGMFATTFGDSLPLAKALADRGVPFLRIQLGWQDDHNFEESQFAALAKEAKRFCPLAAKTKLYLSGACEHNLNTTLAQRLASLIAAACPPAIYVNVPWKGAVLPQYINEIHGKGSPKSARSSYSSDGSPSEDLDIENLKSRFANSEFFMFWSPRYNGRWEDNDSTPRPNRKGYADSSMVKSMLNLANPKGQTSLPKNFLYKSHSENKGNKDPRAEKPVAIIPIKASHVELRAQGRVLSSLKYYGQYSDGRSRYYAPSWGYMIAKEPVELWVKGKKYGSVNPGFRDGDFR